MAYPDGFWFELVRSSSTTALIEDAAGHNVWLRTSDGEPLEQQYSDNQGGWITVTSDTDEPDYVSGIGRDLGSRNHRFRKAGEAWLPSDAGVALNRISWNGRSAVRYGPGYFPGYWAELVRSSSTSSLRENAAGNQIWLRTSDGEPLRQQFDNLFYGFVDITADENEPDSVGPVGQKFVFRAMKPGQTWIPSDTGFRLDTIPWRGASTYRFFEVSDDIAYAGQDAAAAREAGALIVSNHMVALSGAATAAARATAALRVQHPEPLPDGAILAGDGGTGTDLLWQGWGLINPGLVVNGATAYGVRLRVRYAGIADFRTSTREDDTTGVAAGPEMIAEWEIYNDAIRIICGSLSLTIAGPNASTNRFRDSREPYLWLPGNRDAIRAFIDAYRELPQGRRNLTYIVLSRPVIPIALAGRDAAAAREAGALSLQHPPVVALSGSDVAGAPADATLSVQRHAVLDGQDVATAIEAATLDVQALVALAGQDVATAAEAATLAVQALVAMEGMDAATAAEAAALSIEHPPAAALRGRDVARTDEVGTIRVAHAPIIVLSGMDAAGARDAGDLYVTSRLISLVGRNVGAARESGLLVVSHRGALHPLPRVETHVQWGVLFDDPNAPRDQRRFWTGERNIIVGGELFRPTMVDGRSLMTVSEVEHRSNNPNRRARIAVAVSGENIRRALSVDIGPIPITIYWLASLDGGHAWEQVGHVFQGRLSDPVITDGVYSAEVETWLGDIFRGEKRQWSDETQRQKYPGDKGLEFIRSLADGFERRWPP